MANQDDLAVVQYSSSTSVDGEENRPKDLIVHEALKGLVHDVQQVKQRCSRLEDENKQLKSDVVFLKQELAARPMAAGTNYNLTGYAASDSSYGDVTALDPSELACLKEKINEHHAIFSEILHTLHQDQKGEITKREALQKEVNTVITECKNVETRVGSLDNKFNHMNKDMDNLELIVNDVRRENTYLGVTSKGGGPIEEMRNSIEKFRNQLKFARDGMDEFGRKLNFLEEDVTTQRHMISKSKGLQNGHAGSSIGGSGQEGWAFSDAPSDQNGWGWSTPTEEHNGTAYSSTQITACASENDKPYPANGVTEALELTQNRSRAAIKAVEDMAKAHEKSTAEKRSIDNCATREALCRMFHDFTTKLDDPSIEDDSEEADNLWALRDRVIVRLSVFDAYGKALHWANKSDPDLM